jgi:hypothetical protein
VSPTPKCSDQCSFERLRKAWRWLQYEPKHVADVVCSHQYLTFCVWQFTATELFDSIQLLNCLTVYSYWTVWHYTATELRNSTAVWTTQIQTTMLNFLLWQSFSSSSNLADRLQAPPTVVVDGCRLSFPGVKSVGYESIWAWGGVVVNALRYQSEGPCIDPQWCHWECFPWHQTIPCARGRLSLLKWVPGYSWGKDGRCV